jgi:hypothetical protein
MKRAVLLTLGLLAIAGATRAQSAADKTYAAFPTGEGDPDAITCRPPQPLPDSRLRGPEVCKKNSVWARYRRDGMDVASDGIHDVALGSKNGINCSVMATPGGATWTGRMNMKCQQAPEDSRNAPPAKSSVICRTGSICG